MKTLLEQYNFNVKESNDKEILLCVGGIFEENWNVLKKRMDLNFDWTMMNMENG